jgi:8-oxo-dGTP diphosphatase
VRRIVSSPFLRCVQTVEPLAVARGLEVERTEALAEGADPHAALELLLELEAHAGVACAHGDLVPALLQLLVRRGMEVDVPLLDAKGSVWVLDIEGGEPRRGRYVPPRS